MKRIVIGLAVLTLAVFQARAAGMTTHMFMSELALDKISDPELKALLKSQRNAVLAGTVFPDTGNGLKFTGWPDKYNFGPVAHEQPFLEAYLAYIKQNCPRPYSDHCQLVIAHFMGTAAHLMEDGTSHNIFQWYVNQNDLKPGVKGDLDIRGDQVLIENYHRGHVIPHYDVPAKDIAKIFSTMGLHYSWQSIVIGNQVHHTALVLERAQAPLLYSQNKKRFPWMWNNFYQGPGGIDFSSTVVAKYWDCLWQRLSGKDDQVQAVIGTFPLSGTEKTPGDTRVYAMFGKAMLAETITETTFLLRDATGRAVPAAIWRGKKPEKHKVEPLVIFYTLAPASELKPGETYTVTLTTAILDLDHKPLPAPYSWSFTVAK